MPAHQVCYAGLAGRLYKLFKYRIERKRAFRLFSRAVRILAEQNARAIAEFSGVSKLRQHTVYAVRLLVNVLDKEYLAARIYLPWRAEACRHKRKIAAAKLAFGLSGNKSMHRYTVRILILDLLAEQHCLCVFKRIRRAFNELVARRHSHMVRSEAALLAEGDVAAGRAAVDAGVKAVEEMGGQVYSAVVIANPHPALRKITERYAIKQLLG